MDHPRPHVHAAGYASRVINPRQAPHVAKALLQRATSAAIDATMRTQLALRLQPAPRTSPPAVEHEVQQRLAQRDTWVGMRAHLRDHLHALRQGPVVIAAVDQRMATLLAPLTAPIAEVEQDLVGALRMDARWAAAAERVLSITGMGLVTTGWLVVATLHVSLCRTPEEATAYAGLAPREWQSGTSVQRRRRIGHPGHGRLRTALYLAPLSATQHNPVIKTVSTRLREAGKQPNVARCAAARNLLPIAWAGATKEHRVAPSYQKLPSSVSKARHIAA